MLVQVERVSLTYPPDREVLTDVSFGVPEGGFYLITGKSGAGKTSLLRLLSGTERPVTGKIFLFGTDVAYAARAELTDLRRQIGLVFQDSRLIPHLSAFQNVALPLRLTSKDETYITQCVRELLDWGGLGPRRDTLASELSGGETRRVAIARAVISKPRLLLADEPMENIDGDQAAKLYHLFEQLNKMGTTIMIATHHQHVAERFRKPILRLQAGLVIEQMPPVE